MLSKIQLSINPNKHIWVREAEMMKEYLSLLNRPVGVL